MEYADGLVAGTVQNITPPNGFYHYRKIDFFCQLKQFSSVFWKPTKLTEESYPIKIKLSSISSTRPMEDRALTRRTQPTEKAFPSVLA
jgi:hypothetical protein